MKRNTYRLILSMLVAVVALSANLKAQDDVTVESVIKMHIKSIGEVETIKAVKTMVTESTMTANTPMGEMEIAMKQVQADNKFLMTQTIPQMGDVTVGSNGEVFWSMNPFQGAQLLQGEQLNAMKSRMPKLFSEVDWPTGYDGEITMDGTEDVEGKPAYKLVFTPTSGQPEERYFDKETGRMVKMITGPNEILATDFKTVEGITMAHKQIVSTPQGEAEMVINSLKINAELEENTFALPEDVQALVDDK